MTVVSDDQIGKHSYRSSLFVLKSTNSSAVLAKAKQNKSQCVYWLTVSCTDTTLPAGGSRKDSQVENTQLAI